VLKIKGAGAAPTKTPNQNRENPIMSTVRRYFSSFLLATIVAAGLVLTPATARADDLTLYCSWLAGSIEFLESKPNPPQGLLANLRALYDTYCTAE
jgi:hypothetical protein